MKFFLGKILLFIYVLDSTGLSLNIDQCCQRIDAFFASEDNCCCAGKDSCCDGAEVYLYLDTDQEATSHELSIQLAAIQSSQIQQTSLIPLCEEKNEEVIHFSGNHSPPIYQLNCSFIFYG